MRTVEAGPRSSPELNTIIGDFVSTVIWGVPGQFENYCALGVLDGDILIAGVVYHNHYPDAGVIELSTGSISKRWLTGPVLRAIFALPFDSFGCQLCVIRVSERNAAMLRIAKSVGFTDHIIPRLRGRGEAEHILTLTDDDWRQSRFHKEH